MVFYARVLRMWQRADGWSDALLPLAFIFQLASCLRRSYFRWFARKQPIAAVVIVVGNITVGGSGKTPLVMWLVEFLRREGFHPGIASRGYGGRSNVYPRSVDQHSSAIDVGDEPLMMALACACPVVVDPKRPRALRELVEQFHCDIIISDDGLQHYAMTRDAEIIVVNGRQGFGNGRLLPAGPLREGLWRLRSTPWVIASGEHPSARYSFQTTARVAMHALDADRRWMLEEWTGTVHAVAGIGDPGRFFQSLRANGLHVIEHPFPDHHAFTRGDITFNDQLPIFMTQKDWVKIRTFATQACWYVPLDVAVDDDFIADFRKMLPDLRKKIAAERAL